MDNVTNIKEIRVKRSDDLDQANREHVTDFLDSVKDIRGHIVILQTGNDTLLQHCGDLTRLLGSLEIARHLLTKALPTFTSEKGGDDDSD